MVDCILVGESKKGTSVNGKGAKAKGKWGSSEVKGRTTKRWGTATRDGGAAGLSEANLASLLIYIYVKTLVWSSRNAPALGDVASSSDFGNCKM